MDERLMIPKELRQLICHSLHWGHPRRDAMLQASGNIWWPHIHREIVLLAKNCEDCKRSGKIIKCLLPQKQFGKIPESEKINDEIAIDFAGPFQVAHKSKKYLLVSIDNKSNWPDAMFLSKPTTKDVSEFLNNYVATYGIPKSIKTDPGTAFTSRKFQEFCDKNFIKHIKCPIQDHRGNGKIERLIRTVNERLRTNKQVVLRKYKSGLSEILFALRLNKQKEKESPFKQQFGREPNTVKSIIIEKPGNVSGQQQLNLEIEEFPRDTDSSILVRERSRGTKLESTFRRKDGKILGESEHTIPFLPKRGRVATRYSKRDVAKEDKRAEKEQMKRSSSSGGAEKETEKEDRSERQSQTESEKAPSVQEIVEIASSDEENVTNKETRTSEVKTENEENNEEVKWGAEGPEPGEVESGEGRRVSRRRRNPRICLESQ